MSEPTLTFYSELGDTMSQTGMERSSVIPIPSVICRE